MLTKDEDGCSEMFVMKTHLKCEPLLGISNVCRFEKNIDVTERDRERERICCGERVGDTYVYIVLNWRGNEKEGEIERGE